MSWGLLAGALLLGVWPATLFAEAPIGARISVQASDSEKSDPGTRLAQAALERTRHTVRYDGRYRAIDYPNGDVPDSIGVCTDVVVRSYRALGFDLQVAVHEDMRRAFADYPKRWGLASPDRNIDHRRVPNLERFFERQGARLPATGDPRAYRPGDLVTWILPNKRPHIGIVSALRSGDNRRPLIVHNVGAGTTAEDVLFAYEIRRHFRFHVEPSR